MSKKKTFNLIALILHALMLIGMIALPYVHIRVDKTFAWAMKDFVEPGIYTFIGYMIECPYVFATIFVGLIVLNAIICFVSIINKSPKKDGVVHVVLAIIILIMGFMFYIEPHFITGFEAIPNNGTKTFTLAILIAIAILSVMKRSNIAFPNAEIPITIVSTDNASTTNDLKEYKELLDSGVITQEEFDAKKKQLLDL